MAKVLFTAIVADMRNKLNGTVFSKNRYGAYTRTKVTPVNPQSTAQQLVRQYFGSHAQAWRGLTEAERQSWIDGAGQFPMFDVFGNSKILSGQALYNRLNTNLTTAGASPIATCPAPVAIPLNVITSATAAAGAGTLSVAFAASPVPADFALVIMATPPVSPGINFVKPKYRIISIQAAAATTPLALGAQYASVFGSLIAGQKVFVKGFLISTTTGQRGVESSTSDIIAA